MFAPVASLEIVRLVVALGNFKEWKLFQIDIKSTFLNGPLEEEVYMSQPPRFEVKGKKDMVFKLRKALYGLKQGPRAWNKRIDSFLLELGFVKCYMQHGIYVKAKTNVDDLIIT